MMSASGSAPPGAWIGRARKSISTRSRSVSARCRSRSWRDSHSALGAGVGVVSRGVTAWSAAAGAIEAASRSITGRSFYGGGWDSVPGWLDLHPSRPAAGRLEGNRVTVRRYFFIEGVGRDPARPGGRRTRRVKPLDNAARDGRLDGAGRARGGAVRRGEAGGARPCVRWRPYSCPRRRSAGRSGWCPWSSCAASTPAPPGGVAEIAAAGRADPRRRRCPRARQRQGAHLPDRRGRAGSTRRISGSSARPT